MTMFAYHFAKTLNRPGGDSPRVHHHVLRPAADVTQADGIAAFMDFLQRCQKTLINQRFKLRLNELFLQYPEYRCCKRKPFDKRHIS